MSAAQHAAMADRAKTAELHGAQYDPNASKEVRGCTSNARVSRAGGACWTSASNPTQDHLDEAKKHGKMAADHRAASQALRDAEVRSCVGISDSDRDTSPFEHREDVASVEPLVVGTGGARGQTPRTEGATITFRAVPGMTAQWLQRVVDCHLARNAAVGQDAPEMTSCPLALKGASARVTGTDTGFAVAVRSDDSSTAQEILRRARALTAR